MASHFGNNFNMNHENSHKAALRKIVKVNEKSKKASPRNKDSDLQSIKNLQSIKEQALSKLNELMKK